MDDKIEQFLTYFAIAICCTLAVLLVAMVGAMVIGMILGTL